MAFAVSPAPRPVWDASVPWRPPCRQRGSGLGAFILLLIVLLLKFSLLFDSLPALPWDTRQPRTPILGVKRPKATAVPLSHGATVTQPAAAPGDKNIPSGLGKGKGEASRAGC